MAGRNIQPRKAAAAISHATTACPARPRASAAWFSVPAARWKPMPTATTARPQRP